MSVRYRLLRAIAVAFFRLCARYRVVGLENLPRGGPLIVAINHIHTLDSPAAMAALPLEVTAFATRKWERHANGLILRLAGAIFVSRGEVDRQALAQALKTLAQGRILGLAPEGTRSPTQQLQAARGGVAYLAYLSGAPILPVAVTGVEHVIPSLLRLRRARVQVTIGEPFALPTLDHRPKADELRAHADLVMCRIAALLPAEYRGVYADTDRPVRNTPAPRG
jgi:1-acyl-sn-glycerol-3-phosphate acyltransferase